MWRQRGEVATATRLTWAIVPHHRDQTIDIAKGLAIAMIVLGHVLRGMASSRLVDADASWYVVVDSALYQVHLPAFVFLAGLFVKRGVERRGARSYLATGWLALGYV